MDEEYPISERDILIAKKKMSRVMKEKKIASSPVNNSFNSNQFAGKNKSFDAKYTSKILGSSNAINKSPNNSNEVRYSEEESRYLDIISKLDPIKGRAVVKLSDYLNKKYLFKSKIDSLEFAFDILSFESNDVLDALSVLLEDGFSGGVGELLNIAKNV